MTIVVLVASCSTQEPAVRESPKSLVLPPSATEVRRSYDGFWFSEGCDRIKYNVNEPYPAKVTLNSIFSELHAQGWTPAKFLRRRFLSSPGATKSYGKWESFKNGSGFRTYVRAEQWTNSAGDLVSYVFWYITPSHDEVEVTGMHCAASVIEKFRCIPQKRRRYVPEDYSLILHITDVQPMGKNYRVSVTLQNDGRNPVRLGLNGALPDGKPELWVLGLEQEDEPGQWGSVDAVCPEHPAFDHMILKPGDRIDSWVMAVEFPKPDYRFAVCHRHIAHLHGRIRAYIRYYTDACEVDDPFNSPAHFATSEPVELPKPK
jgi:hypothetical protein